MNRRTRFLFHLVPLTALLAAAIAHAGNATATAGEWRPRQTAFALVSASQQTTQSLPFPVRILSLPIVPGAQVETGQTLVTFDAPRLRRHLVAWQLARRELTLAQQQLKVLRRNRKEHTVTRRELLNGEQVAAKAETGVDLAWQTVATDMDRLNLDVDADELAKRIDADGPRQVARELGQLKAPFAGVVMALRATAGEQLAADAPIVELESLARVYLEVGVPESALAQWQQGESSWEGPSGRILLRPLAGLSRLDPNTGLWLLRFEASNPGYRLQDHAWVEVQHLGNPLPVAWLPAAAVVSRNGKEWVMVSDGKHPRPVEVQVGPAAEDGRIPVIKGIAAGTRVVTEGAYELLYRDLKDLIKFVD